ncbi:MAG: hypothetical protein HND48_06810 [Chloroflexi bacterium]|nr:hypothetical protein [Chloroflexota bacterium]
MLLTLPAIRALKAARPDLELHALVGPWAAPVLENVKELNRVLTLPFPGFGRSEEEHTHSPYVQAIRTSRMLRKIGYDSAVILRPDHWWGRCSRISPESAAGSGSICRMSLRS